MHTCKFFTVLLCCIDVAISNGCFYLKQHSANNDVNLYY